MSNPRTLAFMTAMAYLLAWSAVIELFLEFLNDFDKRGE